MRTATALAAAALLATLFGARPPQPPQQVRRQYTARNPSVDYDAFLANAREVGRFREQRRVSEQDFLEMSREPDTIVLDARSEAKFRMLHVKGAGHLSLPDFAAAELARLIPGKTTRVLIYCNNNFENEPAAFPTQAVSASLNLHTLDTL